MHSDQTEDDLQAVFPHLKIEGRISFNAQHYQFSDEPANVPFSRKDFYKIWLINSDSYLHFADRSIHIDRPALIFSNPLVPYAYDGLSRERTGYWCIFTKEFLANDRAESLQESPLFKIGSDNVFFPDEYQLPVITSLFDQIITELDSTYIYKYEVIKNYVNLLIHQGMKMQPVLTVWQHHSAAARIAGLFLELLERQFPIETPQQPLKLKKANDFAFHLSVHVNHLNAVVKEVTGKPTSAHIAERVINEGKALLKHTSWSIADIAYSLGFEYPNHFNNFFKKHTTITPLSFRKL